MSLHPVLPMPALRDAPRAARVQHRLDQKTKPQGALGRLEPLAVQLAQVLGSDAPRLVAPQLVVFAGDHGVARHGVSAYPAEVTPQMVRNMLAGGAAVSVLGRLHALTLTVVDCGVAFAFDAGDRARGLVDAKVCFGSADCTVQAALTSEQCDQAVHHGEALVARLPGNVLLLGEMGIANTSAAALLMARTTGRPLAQCIGRGTGLDDAGLARKQAVLARALKRHEQAAGPMQWLAAFGGAEIAVMVGAVIAAARGRRVVLVDGFITTAAVAVAAALQPAVLDACVFSHASAESGHARWLESLGVQPLLDLGLRLGEGSGAALAWPLLRAAETLLADMASFGDAGVSRSDA
jgi:nicotinate-nucleotide--dimethylbenzimidazole phosphoribosyltransferase